MGYLAKMIEKCAEIGGVLSRETLGLSDEEINRRLYVYEIGEPVSAVVCSGGGAGGSSTFSPDYIKRAIDYRVGGGKSRGWRRHVRRMKAARR